MNGVFHSMVTQGHVSINRFLSTTHTYLGLFRSHGQRVFVKSMADGTCSICRRHSKWRSDAAAGYTVTRRRRSRFALKPPRPTGIDTLHSQFAGTPTRFLVSHQSRSMATMEARPARRFGARRRRVDVLAPASRTLTSTAVSRTALSTSSRLPARMCNRVGGDELLFRMSARASSLIYASSSPGLYGRIANPRECVPADGATDARRNCRGARAQNDNDGACSDAPAERLAHIADIVPGSQNAFVHYLSPRGLEQYSGGGWGTRDVAKGPSKCYWRSIALSRSGICCYA